MKLLGVDTATEACSVALWNDGVLLRRIEVASRGHGERIGPRFEALMAEAGLAPKMLDGVVCGIGPGSFAGVRIGVGFAQGLALALDRPVLGVDSLHLLAVPSLRAGATEVVAAIDARMGEVYWGRYRGLPDAPECLQAPAVASPDAISLTGLPKPWIGVGTGWRTRLADRIDQSCSPEEIQPMVFPDIAEAMLFAANRFIENAFFDPAQLRPLYLRNRVAATLIEQRQARVSLKT